MALEDLQFSKGKRNDFSPPETQELLEWNWYLLRKRTFIFCVENQTRRTV